MAEESAPKKLRTIAVDPKLASMIRTIADHRDITMADVIEKHARKSITKEYEKVVAAMHAEIGGEG